MNDMNIMNKAMPAAAQRAFEAAHQRQATGTGIHNRTRKKQTPQRTCRLSADYKEYMRDEREHREQRKGKHRDEIRALNAKTLLLTQRKPRLTARRLDIAKVKAGADKARAARARDPKRVRAAMVRHMNTGNYSILKERGLRK